MLQLQTMLNLQLDLSRRYGPSRPKNILSCPGKDKGVGRCGLSGWSAGGWWWLGRSSEYTEPNAMNAPQSLVVHLHGEALRRATRRRPTNTRTSVFVCVCVGVLKEEEEEGVGL